MHSSRRAYSRFQTLAIIAACLLFLLAAMLTGFLLLLTGLPVH